MPEIKRIGIFSKPNAPAARHVVPALLDWLDARAIEAKLDPQTAAYANIAESVERDHVPDGCDLIIVLGGDGTLLSAARSIAHREIPVFAVNLGSLGFLTAITVDQLFTELERALQGACRISKRRLLHATLTRQGEVIATHQALNDVVITKSSIARMIEVEVNVNGGFMCRYRADGLILATPTGSTAYSLAAGGPIVFPTVEAVCITPICPHTLTNRPVLVPSDVGISIINHAADESAYLTVDGQIGEPLTEGDRLDCKRSEHVIHLIRPPHQSFFDVLRTKLKWGES